MSTTNEMKYTVTNDSVTVIHGGTLFTVKRGAPNFEGLRNALLSSNWSEVPHHLRSDSSVERWANGKFKVSNGTITYNGDSLPADLTSRIFDMATLGDDPTHLFNFWERLQKNPSARSVEQLWRFLANSGHPITSDGFFLAYKGVRPDFKDCHSGTIDNRPGVVIELPRNKISDDPNTPCHYGLHVGALQYAAGFGSRVVICKVDPADVVCVPFDYSSQKMRVCRYEVVGLHGDGHLPSTTIDDDEFVVRFDLDDDDDFYSDFVDDFYDDDDAAGFTDSSSTYHPVVAAVVAAVEPVEAKPKLRPVTGKRSKKLLKIDRMDESELMKLSYDDLRKYASQGLGIVGAYKITGGKWALVNAITKSR